jgi:hypothetical protein
MVELRQIRVIVGFFCHKSPFELELQGGSPGTAHAVALPQSLVLNEISFVERNVSNIFLLCDKLNWYF